MKLNRLIAIAVIAASITLSGCAKLAVVSEKPPARFPLTSGTNQVVAQTIDRGQTAERNQPLVALGSFIAAAQDSLRELNRNPANIEARRSYNFAVARIFSVIRNAKLDPWTAPMRVGANGEFTLTWKRDPRPEWNLALLRVDSGR